MIAAKVMSSHVVTINGDATVKDAMAVFKESSLYDCPVIDDEGKPLGIVSTRSILHFAVPNYASGVLLQVMKAGPDITSVYENLANVGDKPIAEVMDNHFMTVLPDMPTSAVAAMLINLNHDTHNILVVDAAGMLLGIISARDIICRVTEA